MKKYIFLIIVYLTSIELNSINAENDKVYEIFENIIESIGNNFNGKPKLEIVSTQNNPAYFSTREKKIFIEEKVINLFKDDKNFEDIIAYLIAHELAHHFLNHGWMGGIDFGYSSSIGNFLVDENDINQRKIDETQADIFGGFFAKIAGYDALSFGEICLRKIYKEYKIPNEINGYPSLDERVEIIDKNIEKTNELATIFELANIFIVIGDYKNANNFLIEILNNNFSSREIFNNMGVISLLALTEKFTHDDKKYLFPIQIEQNSRASNNLSRSFVDKTIDELLTISKENFQKSIEKDSEFKKAKINLFITEFIENAYSNNLNKDFLNRINSNSIISNVDKNDLILLYKIFNNKKIKKSDLENSSELSKINYSISKGNNNIEKNLIDVIKYEKIDLGDFIFGFEKPFTKINIRNTRQKILLKKFQNFCAIKYGNDDYIFKIYDPEYINYIKSIKEEFVFSKILKLGLNTYKLVQDEKLVLVYNSSNLEEVIKF